ncbi:MAG TPA: TAT-variant-translocated molybdopterin oxidoreductase [Gemmataceae bacterium]|nr:TAT-variant-translocated molybdopterin oxidoreductase [Gemmataceae bacterium]
MDKPQSSGRRFWRSLEERLESPDFATMMRRDFPDQADGWLDAPTRRRFLALLGASLGLAGLAGCSTRAPNEKIVPYVRTPQDVTPGIPQFYATAMPLAGTAIGLLVESHEGRPTKVEGNPDHPASQGATDVFAQASVLGLYDPDRSQTPISRLQSPAGTVRSMDDAVGEIRRRFRTLLYEDPDAKEKKKKTGAGLRILTEAVASPTLEAQLVQLMTDFPEAQWIEYEPARLDADVEGARIVFGKPYQVRYDFTKADVVVSLDADFLSCGGGQLRYTRDFVSRRRVGDDGKPPDNRNRLYAVEASPTTTGAVADHRLAIRAAQVEVFARILAAELDVKGTPPTPYGVYPTIVSLPWLSAVNTDLKAHPNRSIVIAGAGQPPVVHALAYAINDKLGNIGKTVFFTETPPRPRNAKAGLDGLKTLAGDLEAGKVEVLLILSGNPAYAAPADLQFADKIGKAKLVAHLGLYQDETAERCHWHIPEAHYLESWGDAVAFDGTASIIQPLIAPLYAGKTAIELLSALTEDSPRNGYTLVRAFWADWRKKSGDFEAFWRQSLNDGLIRGTQADAASVKLKPDWTTALGEPPRAPDPDTYEIIFRLDPTVFDGRFANNGWLQELPKPLSKLTWDNAALVGPKTAEKLGIKPVEGPHGGAHGETLTQMVEIALGGFKIHAPLFVLAGHPEDSVTLHFGYGRTRAGKVAADNAGREADAYRIWLGGAPFYAQGASVKKLDQAYTLACTQLFHTMDSAGLRDNKLPADYAAIRSDTQAEYNEKIKHNEYWQERKPGLLPEDDDRAPPEGQRYELPLIPLPPFADKGWGMAVDLSACVGCSACVVACQAENNIPVVGKDQVTRGREMHWLRIDRYYEGDDEHLSRAYFQPVPCMHCETAPCEQVCPVEATVHSPDGLNEMVYNRCVGTRYCSNNCPYKVRRFNFLFYADYTTPVLKLGRNPDVTVRSRGVMEKCTYCVQRIREADIHAQNEGRAIREGEVKTACQAVCPAGAIVFGNINDPNSAVMKRKNSPLNYGLMAELNTRPRTTYLTAITNPNPELQPKAT